MDTIENEQRLKSMREAQKRLTWIDNVKMKLGYDQEKAESEWSRIFDTKENIVSKPENANHSAYE